MAKRQPPAQYSRSTATDRKLAFGSATERASRRTYWIDEMGNPRVERLWNLVEAITNLRAWVTQRLETLHVKLEDLGCANQRIGDLEQRFAAFEAQTFPKPDEKVAAKK